MSAMTRTNYIVRLHLERRVLPGALLGLLGLLALLAGCQAEWDGLVGKEKPGLDPPASRFFFPTGLALTPDARYLFVSNGNADIKYNGGSIVVVDVAAALDRVLHPLAYPLACRIAPREPGVVECQEGPVSDGHGGEIPGVIRPDLTIRLGYYAGFLRLEDLTASPYSPWMPEPSDGEGMRRYRLYVPVRGDPSVTFVDVLYDSEDATDVACLDCGEGCGGSAPRDCSGPFRVQAPSPGRQETLSLDLQAEPYGLALDPVSGFLVVAHLVGGGLSLIDLGGYRGDVRPGGPDLVDALENVMASDSDGRSGGFAVAERTPGDPEGWVYVGNRAASQILTLRVVGAGDPVSEERDLHMVLGPTLVLGAPTGPLEVGADVRGLAFSADGDRLYAATRTPASLVVVDTSMDKGMPRNQVLDVVEVCPKPSVLRTRIDQDGRALAYVVCYGSGEIYVVDTEQAQVVDRIESGGGPHDLAIVPDAADVPESLRGFAFLTNFGEHTVGVVDLREGSRTYHQLIGRLGWPEELQQ